jgi:hypothetical protein
MEEGNSKHILILGKHQYMVDNLQNILSKEGYQVVGFDEVEKATEEYKHTYLDMLVFTGAVNPNDFSEMLKWKEEKFPLVWFLNTTVDPQHWQKKSTLHLLNQESNDPALSTWCSPFFHTEYVNPG